MGAIAAGRVRKVVTKYFKRQDGQWFVVRRSGCKIRCCDCGLTHTVNFRIVGRRLFMQAFRNNRATGQARRKKGVEVTS